MRSLFPGELKELSPGLVFLTKGERLKTSPYGLGEATI